MIADPKAPRAGDISAFDNSYALNDRDETFNDDDDNNNYASQSGRKRTPYDKTASQ